MSLVQHLSSYICPRLEQDESHYNFFPARLFHFLEMLDKHLGAEKRCSVHTCVSTDLGLQ